MTGDLANPLLPETGPVEEQAAMDHLTATFTAAWLELPDPRKYGFRHDDWDVPDEFGYDYWGWVPDEDDGRRPEERADNRARWRALQGALAMARDHLAGRKMVRLTRDVSAWGLEYNRLRPVGPYHDPSCSRHAVCRVVTEARRAAGRYHARALTPPRGPRAA